MHLTRRVQKTGAKAKAGGVARRIAKNVPEPLKRGDVCRAHFDVRENYRVAAFSQTSAVRRHEAFQRSRGIGPSLTELANCRRTGE